MAVANKALWERSIEELSTLKYDDVLELINLDELLDDIDYATTALEPTEEDDVGVHAGLTRAVRILDSLVGLRDEARDRAKRKAIVDTKDDLARMAVDRLGTEEFEAVSVYAEVSHWDHRLVTVKGTFKAKDGRHTFVQVTQPKAP